MKFSLWLISLTLAAGVSLCAQAIGQGAEKSQAFAGANQSVAKSAWPSQKALTSQAALSGSQPPITLLGQVATSSPAESFAVNGSNAYICSDNGIFVVNIANPVNLQTGNLIPTTALSNSAVSYCSILGNSLVLFADQASTLIGNSPAFAAFSLSNPSQPQQIGNAAPLNKRFFHPPVYVGNLAFVPTSAIVTFGPNWDNQYGDLLAIDVSNLTSPTVVGSLQQPQLNGIFGGANPVLNAVQAGPSTLYIGGTSSGPAAGNTGIGRFQVIDITNPAAMKVTAQVSVPGTAHFYAPQIQGKVAVGVGNGGFTGGFTNPGEFGPIVVATFDVTDPKYPILLANVRTNYMVGAGGGAAKIGNNLFAFAGVVDSVNGIPMLLVVDTTDPKNPGIQAYPTGQAFTSMQVIGSTLFATLGANGFASYSIPGSVATSLSCPLSLDSVIVFDRGASVSSAGFTNVKNSLHSFTNAMHLPSDKIGVVTFDQAAALTQQLTIDPPTAKKSIDNLLPAASSSSYIGAGIVAAQAELTGTRHAASATPVMIVVSDGRDLGAPNASATLAAASTAKLAGIRVIALQYGSGSSALMQSIASSAGDFYLVPTP